MRDPDGRIHFEGDAVIRCLNTPADSSHFLHSDLAASWAARGDLITWEWLDAKTLRSPRLPFVTLPSEWTGLQFHAAARLMLKLQSEAIAQGWDAKDATAWNIVFDGLRPVFVDLLSFVPLRTRRWHAAGQFGRHFILPLLLAKKGLMEPYQCLTLWRDGVSASAARRLVGHTRFLTRYWPLMAEGKGEDTVKAIANHTKPAAAEHQEHDLERIQRFRFQLNRGLGWMLEGVNPAKYASRRTTDWGNYEYQRDHYGEADIVFKTHTIASWLQVAKPQWVLDLGCNAGEFSALAVDAGARVICWDGDPKALAILYQRHRTSEQATRYHPVLGPIDDTPSGRGWRGSEFPALMQRLNQRVDVALVLAIVHHLAIAGSIRLADIFQMIACSTRKAAFVELLSETDPRVMQLCRYYGRDPKDFTIKRQLEAAHQVGFHITAQSKRDPHDTREFIWLDRVPATSA